jgi:hypothetical protein
LKEKWTVVEKELGEVKETFANTHTELEEMKEKYTVLEKMHRDEMRNKAVMETELMENKLMQLESEKKELDVQIALADNDIISNNRAEIKSLLQQLGDQKELNDKHDIVVKELEKFKDKWDNKVTSPAVG